MAQSSFTFATAADLAAFQSVLSAHPEANSVSTDSLTETFFYKFTRTLGELQAIAFGYGTPAPGVDNLYSVDGTIAEARDVELGAALTLQDADSNTVITLDDEDVSFVVGDGVTSETLALTPTTITMTVSDGHVVIVGLVVAADDAAAASAGVPLNGLYKTASDVVQIRASA